MKKKKEGMPLLYYPLSSTGWFCIFLLAGVSIAEPRWTQQDESKRIAEMKKEEKRLFLEEMGGHHEFRKSSEEEPLDYGSVVQQYPAPPQYYPPLKSRNPLSGFSPPILNMSKSLNWCFHCASPWHSITSGMQQVVRNLLDVRRSRYPAKEVVSSSCTNPTNLDNLERQPCLYSYCQTLILTDHETGSAFTLRGCAEGFGAIDEDLIAKRGDNTCKRLHSDVDIQECICKNRKYCYTGSERSNLKYKEFGPKYPYSRTGRRNSSNISQRPSFSSILLYPLVIALVLLVCF